MKTPLLAAFALVCTLVPRVQAQAPAPPITDVTLLRAEYSQALAAVEAELRPRKDTLSAAYESGMRSLEQKQMSAKKMEEGLVLRTEADRIRAGKSPAPLPKSASPEWRALRLTYDNQMRAAKQPAEFKARGIRQRYQQQLNNAERYLAAQPDSPLLPPLRMAKMCFAISEQIEAGAYASTPGSQGREEMPQGGALLIGFNVGPGGYSGRSIIKSIQPVFLTAEGETPGEVYGDGPRGHRAVAPPGYAVGGMLVKISDRLDAISITFMKINPVTQALDTKDFKQSDWYGSKGGPQPRQIGGNGRPVIGVSIRSGSDVDGLGLIQLR